MKGIEMSNLIDKECKFYLIHPEESSINRDIFNNLINYEDKEEKKIK